MEEKKVKSNSKRPILGLLAIGIFSVAVFCFLVNIKAANAASLYLSPSSGSYEVGKSFSVSIYVSSADQAMNAASGTLTFPADKLTVTALGKGGSIISLWVQEPSFSNGNGTINFEGIVLNPGYTGSSGKIITINFKTKTTGNAALAFSSGSILANDGSGTNILAGLGSGQYQIGAASAGPKEPEPTTPTTGVGVPGAPQVSSSTHPDPNKWYNKKDANFTWPLPSNINGVSVYFSQSPVSNPGSVSNGLFAAKSYKDIDDGIWYFHVRMRNAAGWGPITHFKIQIDTQPPEPLSIKFVHGQESTDPSPIITFNTIDALSGLDYYRVKIGEDDFLKLDPDLIASNPYALPQQLPGKRTVLAQAFDKAGNITSAAEEFTILPIKTPIITRYPKEIKEGDLLEIRGTTYPDASVDIFLKKEGEEVLKQTTRSNSSGDFTLIWSPKMTNGLYEMSVQVTDSRGAKSNESPPLPIVMKPTAVSQIGLLTINYLSIIFIFISVLFTLMIGGWYVWHRFTLFRKRLRKEVKEADQALQKAFTIIKEDIRRQIKFLEKVRTKRDLTKEEERIIEQLKKDLDVEEKIVRKEIKDIEREIK